MKKDTKKILNDFNLLINDGEIHAIMGPNGTGKSTLSKVIMRDEEYRVLSGNITFDNNDIQHYFPCLMLFAHSYHHPNQQSQ